MNNSISTKCLITSSSIGQLIKAAKEPATVISCPCAWRYATLGMELTLKIIGLFIVITLLAGCAYKSHTPNYHRSYQKCQDIDECALTLKSVIEGNWVNPFPTTKGLEASV